MKKLYVDNYPEILQWVQNNLSQNQYEVYGDNITIHCEDSQHRKKVRESIKAINHPNSI